jgi:hypothetical protein
VSVRSRIATCLATRLLRITRAHVVPSTITLPDILPGGPMGLWGVTRKGALGANKGTSRSTMPSPFAFGATA